MLFYEIVDVQCTYYYDYFLFKDYILVIKLVFCVLKIIMLILIIIIKTIMLIIKYLPQRYLLKIHGGDWGGVLEGDFSPQKTSKDPPKWLNIFQSRSRPDVDLFYNNLFLQYINIIINLFFQSANVVSNNCLVVFFFTWWLSSLYLLKVILLLVTIEAPHGLFLQRLI